MKKYDMKILKVDLTACGYETQLLDERTARGYLGGRGLGTKILYDEQPAGVDPLSPENIIVFATGPLTGTRTPSSGRHFVVSKSPATGGITFTSSGGTWSAELRKAGYDAIVVKGTAERPVYLWIEDGDVELRDAGSFWGKLVSETDEGIRKETHNEAKVLCIGPAGEKRLSIAAIMNEKYRAAGRTGLGAVMGSKNLKAIAVKGEKNIEVADGIGLSRAVNKAMKKISESGVTKEDGGLNAYGTAVLTNIMNASGIYPTKNFQTGTFSDAENISGERMAETILKEKTACYECPIECGRWVDVKSGKYSGVKGESLEYETSWAFGGQCGVNDLGALAKANYLCNEYGLDTISTGSTIGFAMELVDRGIISKDEAGLDLVFGNDEAMIKMIEMMGRREGFGAILADGTRAASKRIGRGSEYYAMQVKGLELPAYDPRGAFGLGLNFATANRGGCHVSGYTIAAEILGVPLKADPFDSTEKKVDLTILFQNLTASVDSSVNCLFLTFALGADDYADMIRYVTGWQNYSSEEFLATGERIFALERLFNKREGFGRKDDTLPQRLLKEPMPEGAPKGKSHPLEGMLDRYYVRRGYDTEGHPEQETLKRLGLA
ncbi:aldehyde:ferredoxin oxidoreductase [Candidatus Methanoperedens nitroreducens]|uniref:Aldehyde:ferredoxin oxidoreductase n=1 Tax=Candidatus Methanoperedens nitratireducens TaxID=1392998 RepID=A0A062VA11_9EURY|nr:aldehyde ferredoxin oxidoreductase family protein [Candidatus Methanoperedens nitroreducens]KCZ73353.1 aldehyde:ferredoxin oxidoreductase [Candidatus Methanoperedens nitroreducens]MDJ1422698.1 aldehyde ferredoxin oxidoreductase family protein [Candidatus Methanoperedens sp.]